MVKLPNIRRSLIAATHDILVAAISFPLALYLRLGDGFAVYAQEYLGWATASFILLFTAIALGSQLHRSVWRYVSMRELLLLSRVTVIAVVGFYLLLFVLMRLEGIPRSVPFIHLMVLGGMLAGTRMAYRAWRERSGNHQKQTASIPVLVVGYQHNAEQFIRDLRRSPNALYHAVGLLDDDTGSHGRQVHGVRVLGALSDITSILGKLRAQDIRPQRIIIGEDYLQPERIEPLLDICNTEGISLARLPRLTDFQDGASSRAPLRPVAIEDILGRAQQVHAREGMDTLIRNKIVLITGAGGTIGGELSRQVASFEPRSIILLDISEFNLYQIDHEIGELAAHLDRIPVLADVRDKARMNHLVAQYAPDVIFHAAAIKHVPLAEANVEQAILTNVYGTMNMADAAMATGVGTMVLISTDKAVNPANVMGAAKRLAERYCQLVSGSGEGATRFVTVRFGNVLGSTGSVVPLFQKQLEAGGPLTVTHPDMERYFMTVREAVELVISAAVMAQDMQQRPGEGFIFVLDMGRPVRIRDLAAQMIRLAGLRPDVDIQIAYTGLRPGEKLYEELFYSSESTEPTSHDGIMLAKTERPDAQTLEAGLKSLYEACQHHQEARAREVLKTLVPEYAPEQRRDHAGTHHNSTSVRLG